LAAALLATRKTQDAYDLFRAAAQGEDSAIAARCLTELGSARFWECRSVLPALPLQREEESGRQDDPLIAVVLNNLGLGIAPEERQPVREPLFRRALAIQERANSGRITPRRQLR